MSDSDLRQTPETDWAERLKQQMERREEPQPDSVRETDAAQAELNSLLRKQLECLQGGAEEAPAESERKSEPEETASESSETTAAAADVDPVPTEEQTAESACENGKQPICQPEPAAPDDELNGVSVTELLDSGAFFRGLDDDEDSRIQAGRQGPADSGGETPNPSAEPEPAAERTDAESGDRPETAAAETVPQQQAAPEASSAADREDPLAIGLDINRNRRARPSPLDDPEIGREPARARKGTAQAASSEPQDSVRGTDTARRTRDESENGENPVSGDTELYMDLGYEDELRRTRGGSDKADAFLRGKMRQEHVGTRNTVPAAYRGSEYTDSAMTEDVMRRYRSSYRMALVRLAAAGIGCLCGVLYDMLPRLHMAGFAGFTAGYAYPLLGVALLLLFSAPSLHRLGLGLRSLWDFEPVRYAVPGMALCVTALHTLISLAAVGGGKTVPLFCGTALLLLTLTCLCDLLSLLAERRSFRIVSSGRARTVITMPAAPGTRTDDRTDDIEISDAGRNSPLTLRLCRTSGVPNFFAAVNRYCGCLSHLNYLMPTAMLMAIAAAAVSVLLGGTLLQDALPHFTAAYLVCLPGAFILSVTLPYAAENRALSREGCAVLGESVPERYAPAKKTEWRGKKNAAHTHFILPDGMVLSPVSPNEVTIRGDRRADEWLRMTHKLFALLDCPLAGYGDPIPREELDAVRLETAESGAEFLRLYMTDTASDGTVEVMLGSHDALAGHGVRLPSEEAMESYKKQPDDGVLYIAYDRCFRVACISGLRIEPEFPLMAERLRSLGCRVSVLSYDPLAESYPLFAGCGQQDLSVGLVRPRNCSRLYAPRSGGIVSVREGTDILRGYFACRRIHRANRIGILFSWLWMLAAGGLAAVLPAVGLPISILPLLCCLWHVVTAGLSCLPAALHVRYSASDGSGT